MPASSTARAVLWVGLAATVVRLLYLAEHAGSAFFGIAVLDEAYYDGVARAMLDAEPGAFDGSFRPFLYPLFLAAAYRLGGGFGPSLAILLQHLLGVATAVLVVLVAARVLRSVPTALVAGLLFALAGPPLFFEGERLITTLFTALISATLYLWIRTPKASTSWTGSATWLVVGLAAALAAQARSNATLLYPVLALAALVAPFAGPRTSGDRPRWNPRSLAALVAGLIAVHLGFAAMSMAAGDRWSLLPSAGGVNLYLGNKRGADGMIPRQDHAVTYGEDYRDSVQVFAEAGYRTAQGLPETTPVPAGRISRYWMARTTDEIRADPAGRFRLILRKVSFLLADREIPNNKSFAFALAHESTALRVLPVRWWLLLALAPLGVLWGLTHGDRRATIALLALIAVHGAGVVLFFVTSRYRIPLWPPMAVLAAGGLLRLATWVRRDRLRRLALAAVVTVTLALISRSIPAQGQPTFARDFFFRSIAQLERGAVEAAEQDARSSLSLDRTDGSTWLQLGRVLLAAERPDQALEAFGEASARLPEEPRIDNGAGVALEALDQPAAAFAAYGRAAGKSAGFAPPWTNAALLELRAGLTARAAMRLERAHRLGDDSVTWQCADALVRRSLGQTDAENRLAALRQMHPTAVDRILADQRRALDTSVLDHEAFPTVERPPS